ncbi:M28 family metallopeptidase [Flindersiella endophytica]
MRHVELLAGEIGPREATSPAFGRAGTYVEQRFREAGLTVRRQVFDLPAGDSWGVRVPSGRSFNVIAVTPGFGARLPHVVVGAHLDTVPQAPGAEDNASGVAVLLELARLIGLTEDDQLRAALIAFGAEEPRGQGDDRHHYGSRAYVARMSRRERAACREMVSMDRVGTGTNPRVRFGGKTSSIGVSGEPVATWLVSAGHEVGVDVAFEPSDTNRSSDHWSFHKGGIPAARLGGNPYSAYHSAADKPAVVDSGMLGATGAVMWEWLNDAPH